ncbi:CKLF6 protein, partial [Alcedo cyanopectus]|nr:CKLF6 protein [Ceyx cyanopectus]
MESGAVYNETTEPQTKAPRRPFGCTLRHLRLWQPATKASQASLSLLAVIFEILVEQCGSVVDFFEFISCTAFLLSLMVLCVYCTDLYTTFGEDKIQKV